MPTMNTTITQNHQPTCKITQLALTVKTDDVTRGRKNVDPHGRFRGEWAQLKLINKLINKIKIKI